MRRFFFFVKGIDTLCSCCSSVEQYRTVATLSRVSERVRFGFVAFLLPFRRGLLAAITTKKSADSGEPSRPAGRHQLKNG